MFPPLERFDALKVLRDNGIPTVVWLCPILPFINDTEENLKGYSSIALMRLLKGLFVSNGCHPEGGGPSIFTKSWIESLGKEKYHRNTAMPTR